ncbi:TPA: response regulator [Pseudomonas aeruginosa]|nr:response regulator [Pseudomonas aeruginosa]HCG0532741.1 response regulator [Pseudomonas aeruginosa]HCG0539027.1 response regulator [Pseudomonas aeruginosa]HCG0543475.1 response regulator [Pseudomonas aeruginosa]HCG0549977.1 response regulator [Pseudomonas aeruginosa]
MRHWLILFLLALPCLAGAVSFNEQVERLPLGQSIDVFEDVRGSADINDITSRAIDSSFRRHDKDVLNAGYSRSVFWLRLDLDYRPVASSDPRTWLLELAYPPLDKLDLYLPDGQGGYRLAQRTGDTLPFASRPIRQNNYLFELGLEPNKPQRVYLRLESQGSIQAPLTLWSPKAYLEEQPERIYVLGIIYGVLLVMLIYNLFIFLSVRDTSYLYYILYIASFGLYQVSVNGAGIEYFWPDSPWWANAATPFLIGSAALFGCQFARSFLHTRDHSVWVDRGLLALMAVGALVMLMALTMSYAVALRLATYLALAFTGLIFAAGILAWLRGMRVARYFIIAWTAFLLGGIVNTLMVLGYLPNMFLTMYASQIGSALEVGLLSLALADRINAMKEERARILQESSRKLVELLGGELTHESRPGQGSRFLLRLQLTQPAQGLAPPPRRAGGQAVRRPEECTVLVVEDNAINQLVTRGMLLKLGYRVRTADNGSEALELLARERPDGVLLDCQMPVMDGFATCRAIRALPGCAELPVLALTAHSHSGDRERCLAAGMSDYMAKPVKFEELQTLLHDWLLCQPIVTKSA